MSRNSRKYADRRDYLISAVKRRRKVVRLRALAHKGGKCEFCGYDRCSEALEFHHPNGKAKEFGLSARGYTRSWEAVREEIDKCVLLCANCHREVHAGTAALLGNREWKTG